MQISKPRDRSLEDMDKINAAVHEAGHVTLIAHEGKCASARIWYESNNGDEWLSTWRGRTFFPAWYRPTPAVVAAGLLAEHGFPDSKSKDPRDLTLFEVANIAEDIEDGLVDVSDTDMSYLDGADVEAALYEAMIGLKRHRSLFIFVRDELMKYGEVTEETVKAFGDKLDRRNERERLRRRAKSHARRIKSQ